MLVPILLLAGCAGVAHSGEPGPTVPATLSPATTRDVFSDGIPPRAGDPDLWFSWALLDRANGRRAGSANAGTQRTNAESTIKAWLAADVLRRAVLAGRPVTEREQGLVAAAVRFSDDAAAERLYRASGTDGMLQDLRPVCGVGVSTSRRGYWSFTQVTAQDAVDILDCVLSRAPTYPGGDRLVADLHAVAAPDAFGIPEVLPAGTAVAVKNGWTAHGSTGSWNTNCVAAWSHYTLAVLTRYPSARTLDHGAAVCRDVAQAVRARLPDA